MALFRARLQPDQTIETLYNCLKHGGKIIIEIL
jgi:hypothetical protein